MRARLARISELIESVGLLNVQEPHVRHIRSQLWEILLRAFIKRTEKTPRGEIELALQRAKDVKP